MFLSCYVHEELDVQNKKDDRSTSDTIDTISLIELTTDILQAINGNKDSMDAEIEAAIAFAKRLNFDAIVDLYR